MNSPPNPRIGSAAANMTRERSVDVLVRRGVNPREQGTCRHDHSRLAIPALRHIFFDPCALNRVVGPFAETLDCCDRAPAQPRHRQQATPHRRARYMHSTGTAQAPATAKLRSRQTERIPQHPEQRRVGSLLYRPPLPVDNNRIRRRHWLTIQHIASLMQEPLCLPNT